jgi:hypothetical protein
LTKGLQFRVSANKHMAIYLIITLGVLLLGAAMAAILAWRQPRYAPQATALSLAIALLIWLVAGRSLPLGTDVTAGQESGELLFFGWHVDAIGWQLSFVLLLMMEAVVVVALAHTDRQLWPDDRPAREKALFPAIVLMSVAALLAVWAGSIASLLLTWVVLSLTWVLLLWAMTQERVGAGRLLPRAGALLLGVLFLWLAMAISEPRSNVIVLEDLWSGRAAYLMLLAAIAPLGALPLQWWRPLAWSLPAETAAIVHLAPVAAGGALLAHSSGQAGEQQTGLLLIGTLLGLISLLVGISIAWMYIASPIRSLSGLALAQAGVVVLAALWVGAAAASAATMVLLLAISGLFLAARWSSRKLPWPAILPLLALAGFPFTAGAPGLASVYHAWLDGGNVVLLLIGALLSIFLLAAGILAVRSEMPADELVGREPEVKLGHYLALALPSLGLISFSSQLVSGITIVAWVTVVVTFGGSLLLSRFETQVQDAQLSLRRALHLGFVGRRIMQLLAQIGSGLDSFIRETAAILEGEGGMLWLLVFLVVIWLARR